MLYRPSLQLYGEGNPLSSSLTSSSVWLVANKIQAQAVAAGPGGEKCYFAREWKGKEGSRRGFWFWTSAAISRSSNQPRSCQHCPPAVQGTLFNLEPLKVPGCARNKTPCPHCGPSTSLHSSDNSLPVLPTLASLPCSFRSFLCTRQLSLAILLWHHIPSLGCLLGTVLHARPCHSFQSPKVGIQGGEMPSSPLGVDAGGQSYLMLLSATWMRGHLNRESIVQSLNLPSCTCPNAKGKTNLLHALKLS